MAPFGLALGTFCLGLLFFLGTLVALAVLSVLIDALLTALAKALGALGIDLD